MSWVRIDNRLIHGQIIETWIPYTGARSVLVANDELASDIMQQQIMSLAIPGNIESHFVTVDAVAREMKAIGKNTIILFYNCSDAKKAFDTGFLFDILNIGNVHYSPGRKQVSPNVALTNEDEHCLKYFCKKGVELDFRCVPNDTVQVRLP
ncbi:PTS sugar transporter subunit IIB [Salidesulfovibrio onnuriiensis]|uniref:PTS sugar transporter subunit IIB n=1 Tax=Salidesulfovibrio onnuriiensis TaxID=2583823 RepID=UPI0011C835C1|nr:PTS sugar transporter subunit IIB [Salidesulfovibrio onnuriiensis]